MFGDHRSATSSVANTFRWSLSPTCLRVSTRARAAWAGRTTTVVDTQGRVKGVQGLRVVDASIFPVVPCANTNFPTLLAAEKIAEAMQ